jgi:isopenicillin N synthase-like dioxygenase
MTTTMLNSPSSSPSEIATAKSLARTIPDYKESFELGREDNDRMKNIWLPESHLPGFRAFMNHFYEVMQTLEMAVFRAIAIGLEMEDEEFFVRFHQNADNQTRLLHYPPVPLWVLREGKMERCGGHADFGTITFLFQDGVGGLEVEDQDQEQPEGLEGPEGGKGVFRPVPSVRGAVLVNVGDCLQMWTNGILRSAVHRVAAPPAFEGVGLEEPGSPGGGGEDPEEMMIPSRYSIPYFCGPDTEKVLECAPGCWSAETPKRYGPMTVGEFIDAKMALLV